MPHKAFELRFISTGGLRMAIEQIRKINSHRIFRRFIWRHDLLDFKEKSLFYG